MHILGLLCVFTADEMAKFQIFVVWCRNQRRFRESDGEGVGKTAIEAQSLLKIYCAFLLRFSFSYYAAKANLLMFYGAKISYFLIFGLIVLRYYRIIANECSVRDIPALWSIFDSMYTLSSAIVILKSVNDVSVFKRWFPLQVEYFANKYGGRFSSKNTQEVVWKC